jgi:negative regulator of sigma-B (phosphoserine phosphatase)
MAKSKGNEAPDGLGLIAWGAAGRPLPGQAVSGDLFLVKPFPGGALAAVVDGLGHGEAAAAAARHAVRTLEPFARQPPLALVGRCHRGLRDTRGVVLSLASYDAAARALTWLGVGNVAGALQRAGGPAGAPPERLRPRRGVVGYQLPALRADVLTVGAGDTLLLATDGIRSEFADEAPPDATPQQVAEYLLERHGKDSDDALVLVVRFLGTEWGTPVP